MNVKKRLKKIRIIKKAYTYINAIKYYTGIKTFPTMSYNV